MYIYINPDSCGIYKLGLTEKETKQYIKDSAGTTRLGNLYKKFCKIAGVNTMGMVSCECCGKTLVLWYRCDVERFTDQLLTGKPTYFD